MADPAHYETSEYYQPGLITSVGNSAGVILVILLVFILAVVAARAKLNGSRRMNRRTRRALELVAGIAKPAGPLGWGRRRQRKLGRRRKTEAHYKIKSAEPAAGPRAVPASAPVRQLVEQPAGRRRPAPILAPFPEEAWPSYDEDEIAEVSEILRSGKVNQWTGTKVFEFEQAYNRSLPNGRAIALANGSVALELALKAYGIGPGDEVIVTPRSFVASAFCVRLVGATPVFADVDRDSGNITAATIAAAITSRTKAIIPVHIGGWPADMHQMAALAKERGLYLIEDCAQAHGAEIDGFPVGSFGDAATFSFCQDKIISTAGEGGLVSFKDSAAFEWAWSFKDHGKNREKALQKNSGTGFRWLHDNVGTNWRMTEISAAIGLLQLDKLPRWRRARTTNADIWAQALSRVPGLRVPLPPRNVTGAFYKFYFYVDVDEARNEVLRDKILAEAAKAGIRIFSGSCSEMYREVAFTDLDVKPLANARALGQTSLMVEVHPTLDTARLKDRADALAQIITGVLA